jgi:branched-chain amino acid transport system substrate-binding protein
MLSLVFLFTVSACGGNQTAGQVDDEQTSETIKFAIVGPMTGDTAAWGNQMEKGVEMALAEINGNGGINGQMLEFSVYDDQSNPNQAAIAAQKIAADDSLLFVVGHVNSGCTIAGAPIYQEVGLPVITPDSSNPDICNMGFETLIRIMANDYTFEEQQVALAVKELGKTNIAILYENTDFGQGACDVAIEELAKYDLEPLGVEAMVPNTDRDFSAQITKFKGLGVDCVLLIVDYTGSALFAQQNITLGLNAALVGLSGASHPKLIEIGGEAVEDMYLLVGYDPNDPRPKQSAFTAKFRETYGEDSSEFCAQAYDAVNMAALALETGGTTRETFLEQMHNIKDFDGVTGTMTILPNGDVEGKKVAVTVVKDGAFASYIPTKY